MTETDELSTYLARAMTVKELREALDKFEDDTRVVFSYQYGDHARTVVAGAVKVADESDVRWSGYHDMPMVVEADEPEDDEPRDVPDETVVVLS